MTLPQRFDLPPLARIETSWHPPWIVSGVMQQGIRHYRDGDPCQDAYVIGGIHETFWLVLADGVSTAPRSHYGSRVSTAAVQEFLAAAIKRGDPLTRELMEASFDAAHQAITTLAKAEKKPVIEYTSTLAAVVIHGDTILAGNIGDSSIVAYTEHLKDGEPTTGMIPFCSAPQPASSKVYTIYLDNWREHFTTTLSDAPHIKGIILATDGEAAFFLDDTPDAQRFDTRFMDALDDTIRAHTPRYYCDYFAAFIKSNEAQNKDDRTFLVAYRLPEDLRPPTKKPL
jgi:hypothetical protein